jgi:hypothetical protein
MATSTTQSPADRLELEEGAPRAEREIQLEPRAEPNEQRTT